MSRKTSVRGSSTELEEDKLARLQLLEAKRKLASTRRSPKPDAEKDYFVEEVEPVVAQTTLRTHNSNG